MAFPVLAALPGCDGLGDPRRLRLSRRELEERVRGAFPLQRRLLEVFETTLGVPTLRLLPELNRIGAVLEVALRERVMGGSWSGWLDFDSLLRWEPHDQSLRLAEVRVQDFKLAAGADAPRAAERLGALAAERMLEGLVLYRLNPERSAELQRRGLVPQGVNVTAQGLEVTFEADPAPTRR